MHETDGVKRAYSVYVSATHPPLAESDFQPQNLQNGDIARGVGIWMGNKAAAVVVIVLAAIFYPILCYAYDLIGWNGPFDTLFCSGIGMVCWFGMWGLVAWIVYRGRRY